MRVLITFGPSFEPIDQARRLTNFSTGKLGTQIANHFLKEGWNVHCLRAEGATYTGPLEAWEVESFTTNDDLADRMERIGRMRRIDAVFHAAALCDFRVARVVNKEGESVESPKIATRDGRLTLELEPATKILPKIRGWFPTATVVGWKYEFAGSRDDAFEKAWRQLAECETDACVLNGAAHGPGFTICEPRSRVTPCDTVANLATALHRLVTRKASPSTRAQVLQFAA